MKKVFVLLIILSATSLCYSHSNEVNRYSKEIDCDYPLSDEISTWLKRAEADVDKEYNLTWSEQWIMLGSTECYISE